MNAAPPSVPAGWFPDPLGRHEHRYFNGSSWTPDVSDGGVRRIDPLGTGPSPANGPVAGRGGPKATAAMVCGIIAVLLAAIPFLVVAGIVLAILALVFGIRTRRHHPTVQRSRATAGVVLGIVGLGLSIVGLWYTARALIEVVAFVTPVAHTVTADECTVEDGFARATGSIVNDSESTADFTVFVVLEIRDRDGYSKAETVIEVDHVEPGTEVPWMAFVQSRSGAEATCETVRVDAFGPFPFDRQMERP